MSCLTNWGFNRPLECSVIQPPSEPVALSDGVKTGVFLLHLCKRGVVDKVELLSKLHLIIISMT